MGDARIPLAETVLLGPPGQFALNQDTDRMVRYFLDCFGGGAGTRGALEYGFRLQAASGGHPTMPVEEARRVPVCRVSAYQDLAWHQASRTPRVPDVEAIIGLALYPAASELAGCKPRRAVEVLYRLFQHWPAGQKYITAGDWGRVVSLEVDAARLRPEASPGDAVRAAIRLILAGYPPDQAIARAYEDVSPAPRPPRHRMAGAGTPHIVYHAVLGPARIPPDLAWLLNPPGQFGTESARAAVRERRSIGGFRIGLCPYPPSDLPMVPMAVEEAGDGGEPWLFAGKIAALSCDGYPALELRCSLLWREFSGDRGAMAVATVLRAWPDGQKILAFDPDMLARAAIARPGPVCRVGLRLGGLPFSSVEAIFHAALQAALRGTGAPRLRQWLARLTAADARALEILAALG
ncbi:MAG TPA: hypothetical protein VIK99_05730 [Thermaerobacter sp.]